MTAKLRAFVKAVDWTNSLFVTITLLITVVGVPVYLWHEGLSLFQAALFLMFFAATGLSITLGYHRLFSHLTFKASWPVRMATLVFGAAAFENSALCWAANHRRHHKHVDHDHDPYDISKGFFHAHIGWMLSKENSRIILEDVQDLQKDKLVQWQHKNYLWIAILAGFTLPALLGALWSGGMGAIGGFLIAGVARVVFVHHMTFFINSWSHTWGSRPYSTRCTARDNGVLALFTFGEGYHNFHHEFQHDYRNGVKPWQFDPTKWCIWLLNKMGLARQLRRVPEEKILLAQLAEQQRLIAAKLVTAPAPLAAQIHSLLEPAQQRLQQAIKQWEQRKADYRTSLEKEIAAPRETMATLRRDFREASVHLRQALREWKQAHQMACAQLD